MKEPSLEPESSASANSAIPAKDGGQGWIRTIEVSDGRFTVCSLWPLGNLPIRKGIPNGTLIIIAQEVAFVNRFYENILAESMESGSQQNRICCDPDQV